MPVTGGAQHKNVLLMIADDLGQMLGCTGLDAIHTPNIDALAAEGARFTNGYASTASCSGSRSTLYTGLHTHQNGQYGLQQGWCHFQTFDHVETVPRVFNAIGYQTGIIGKVHVGPKEAYPWEWFSPSLSRDVRKNAAEAGQFFDKAGETDRPFHLTIGFRDPHRDSSRGGFGNDEEDVIDIPVPDYKPEDVVIPEFSSDVPELRQELVEYYKSISRLDVGVGLVLQELAKRGLDKNTLVIFISDNGAPFVNSKTTLYDAGVRLPLVIRQPDAPRQGVVNPNMVSWVDIFPTTLDWAGFDESVKVDTGSGPLKSPKRLGHSFLSILSESDKLGPDRWTQHVFGSHTFHEIQNYWPTRFMRDHRYKYHRNIAWRLDFPFATDIYNSLSWQGIRNSANLATANATNSASSTAADASKIDTPEVMLGRRRLQKYIFRGPEELFDLQNDPEEVNNLATDATYAERVAAMRATLEAWQYETNDPWLFRDGVSAMTTQTAQKEGLRLPDRFDFDPLSPRNDVGPHWAPVNAKEADDTVTEFG